MNVLVRRFVKQLYGKERKKETEWLFVLVPQTSLSLYFFFAPRLSPHYPGNLPRICVGDRHEVSLSYIS